MGRVCLRLGGYRCRSISWGMLIIWNSDLLEIVFSFSGRGFVGVYAKWKTSNETCFLVNVYSPCSLERKKELLRDLLLCKRSLGGNVWCVAGDFNAITNVVERRGARETSDNREISSFNQFISEMELVDVPMLGKRYSWFSGDRRSKSGLDRSLLSEDAINNWNVAAQWVGDRDISDHCPFGLIVRSMTGDRSPLGLIIVGYNTMSLRLLLRSVGEVLMCQGGELMLSKKN